MPLLNLLKWTMLFLIISFIIVISGFAIYLNTSIDKIMSKDKQDKLMTSINQSPELPQSFYVTLNEYFPNAFQRSVWGSLINQGLGLSTNPCQCREIYIHPGYTDHWIKFTQPIVAIEIEKHCSRKKCFEYNMSVSDFGMNTRGIQGASKRYYSKEIDKLSEREILELIVIQKAPTTFNPFFNRDNLDQAVNNIINKNSSQSR